MATYRFRYPVLLVRIQTPHPSRKSFISNRKFVVRGGDLTTTPTIDVSSLVTALNGAVTAGDIVTLLSTVIGAGIGLCLVWFGSRKLVSVFMGALKKGKFRI